MTRPLRRLRRLLGQGLERTHARWPDIERAYSWVHQIACILTNPEGWEAREVERHFEGVIVAMADRRDQAGALTGAIDHFLKVTASYRPGLFQCYRVPDLPRTNNDLERLFGAHRYHDRRATGRKTASPTMVLRGSVRLLAATATRLRPVPACDLAGVDRQRWADLRHRLDHRRHGRSLRTRFRRDPQAYLSQLEQQILQPALPS